MSNAGPPGAGASGTAAAGDGRRDGGRGGGDAPAVTSVTAAVYTVPTDSPEADGTLAWDSTTMVTVQVEAAGTTGLGWTYGSPAVARVVDEHLAPMVAGRSAWDVPAANEAMTRTLRNAGRPGLAGYAVSAVDIALWDLKARLLHLPLVHLLGAARDEVPVYGSGGFTTYDDRQQDRQLRTWTEDFGIPRVKIKIGDSWGSAEDRDRRRIGAARRSIGDAAALFVDANGAYDAKQAVRLGRDLAAQDVTWLEEPVSSDDLAGLARVRGAVRADVTAGEYGSTLGYFQQMLDAGAVDCLQADVTRCGGITVWLRTAALAEARGLEISGHCAPHLHAHAAAAVPNLRHLEWFHDHVRIENSLFTGTLDPSGGAVHPGADGAFGHGLQLRPDAARPHRTD